MPRTSLPGEKDGFLHFFFPQQASQLTRPKDGHHHSRPSLWNFLWSTVHNSSFGYCQTILEQNRLDYNSTHRGMNIIYLVLGLIFLVMFFLLYFFKYLKQTLTRGTPHLNQHFSKCDLCPWTMRVGGFIITSCNGEEWCIIM